MKKETFKKILEEDFESIVLHTDIIKNICLKKDKVVVKEDCIIISENTTIKYIDIDSIKYIELRRNFKPLDCAK